MPVEADDRCLFRALAACTDWEVVDVKRAVLREVVDHDWHDLLEAEPVRNVKRQATAILSRPLRMATRWDRESFDLVWRLLPAVVGGPVARYELQHSRELGGGQPDGAVARICAYHRGIGQNHHDAAVSIGAPAL